MTILKYCPARMAGKLRGTISFCLGASEEIPRVFPATVTYTHTHTHMHGVYIVLTTLMLGRSFLCRAARADLELLCPRVVCGHFCSNASPASLWLSLYHILITYHCIILINVCRRCCTHLHVGSRTILKLPDRSHPTDI